MRSIDHIQQHGPGREKQCRRSVHFRQLLPNLVPNPLKYLGLCFFLYLSIFSFYRLSPWAHFMWMAPLPTAHESLTLPVTLVWRSVAAWVMGDWLASARGWILRSLSQLPLSFPASLCSLVTDLEGRLVRSFTFIIFWHFTGFLCTSLFWNF